MLQKAHDVMQLDCLTALDGASVADDTEERALKPASDGLHITIMTIAQTKSSLSRQKYVHQ